MPSYLQPLYGEMFLSSVMSLPTRLIMEWSILATVLLPRLAREYGQAVYELLKFGCIVLIYFGATIAKAPLSLAVMRERCAIVLPRSLKLLVSS